jgi:hypothetical protein
MITRPTTEQILNDCAREVRETLMPAVTDPGLTVTLEMLEQVLAQCALRAGHEMAWMADEINVIEPYVAAVVDALGPDAAAAATALDALRGGRTTSLHLDDRCAEYHLASEALSSALEACVAADHRELTARGVSLLEARRDRETELRPNFFFPGRA